MLIQLTTVHVGMLIFSALIMVGGVTGIICLVNWMAKKYGPPTESFDR